MTGLGRLIAVGCLAVVGSTIGPARSMQVIAGDYPASKSETDPVPWTDSYDQAMKEARVEKKLVMADFTGSDWCHNCVQLHREVLGTPEFKKWAAKHVVLLELDYPQRKRQSAEIKKQNAHLKDDFKIEAYPTVVIISADGKELGRIVSYAGAKEWFADLQKVVER